MALAFSISSPCLPSPDAAPQRPPPAVICLLTLTHPGMDAGLSGAPLALLTSLDLQLHEAMSDLQGVGFAVLPPGLHSVAAVIPTVLQRHVHHHNVKGTMVVWDKLHPMMAGLPPNRGFLGAIAWQLMVPAQVMVQLLLSDVADVLLLRAALVTVAAEVPGFVEQVMAVGKGTADPAGQGDILALRADAQ